MLPRDDRAGNADVRHADRVAAGTHDALRLRAVERDPPGPFERTEVGGYMIARGCVGRTPSVYAAPPS